MIQEKCPYVEKCGACHMGQTTYEEELAAKKELVESHIGKYCRNIHDVAGMYYPFHYRNKVHAVQFLGIRHNGIYNETQVSPMNFLGRFRWENIPFAGGIAIEGKQDYQDNSEHSWKRTC